MNNPWLQNLVPHQAQRGKFQPQPGMRITIQLPGEILLAEVERVHADGDKVVARLTDTPMMRSHQYKKDQIVCARRLVDNALQVEQWEVISEQELDIQAAAVRLFEEQERARIAANKAAAGAAPAPDAPPEPSVAPSQDNWSA